MKLNTFTRILKVAKSNNLMSVLFTGHAFKTHIRVCKLNGQRKITNKGKKCSAGLEKDSIHNGEQ